MKNRTLLFTAAACALFVMSLLSESPQARVLIKMGTLAPEGSPFHDALVKTGQRWDKVSNGQVKLRLYAGGVAGSEPDMLRKMRIGQLHAASISAISSMEIDASYAALQVLGIIGSYEELDYCRTRLIPTFEKRFEDKGFIFLNFGEIGSLYFFAAKRAKSIEELMNLKLCTFAGDPGSQKTLAKAGFKVTDIAVNETLTALQTGMLDGFMNSPVMALSMQWFAKAKYMIDVNYGIGLGATLVSKKQWDKVSKDLQPQLIAIAREEVLAIQEEVRSMDQKAIVEMKKYGLQVVAPAGGLEKWLAPFEKVHPFIRTNLIPADVFDRVVELRNEFRKQ